MFSVEKRIMWVVRFLRPSFRLSLSLGVGPIGNVEMTTKRDNPSRYSAQKRRKEEGGG